MNSGLITRQANAKEAWLRRIAIRCVTAACGMAMLLSGQVAVPAGSSAAGTTTCRGTVFAAVAHEDDDLLFMSPDLVDDWARGACLDVTYLTAGDAGRAGYRYARQREQGVGQAYALLAGVRNNWRRSDRVHASRTIRSFALKVPPGRPGIRVTFLRLPDGLRSGSGTLAQAGQSLLKLERGSIRRITAIDHSASYDAKELTATLSWLIADSQAEIVRTLDYRNTDCGNDPKGDHSDHEAAARFVKSAADSVVGAEPVLVGYRGYSISALPPNVALPTARRKEAVFRRYLSTTMCSRACADFTGRLWASYQSWLARQYRV
ncbi:PIG-L family deacetylase [Streptomyces sp. NPDC094438]|uniref:PIG-L family deacetylase n=1 Tax=Streptomyces sp. NPDC094438 TaxID=3366061 RepID=UPI0038104595